MTQRGNKKSLPIMTTFKFDRLSKLMRQPLNRLRHSVQTGTCIQNEPSIKRSLFVKSSLKTDFCLCRAIEIDMCAGSG
jgi:hypothetical protein